MARLVDIDALRKDFKVAERCEDCQQRHCNADVVFSRRDVCGILDDAPIIDTQSTTQWVSVKDRLPEVGKVVLAFGTRSATTGMFQGINKRNDLWWWKGHTIKHVSHWMPLPEPPKEDEHEAD